MAFPYEGMTVWKPGYPSYGREISVDTLSLPVRMGWEHWGFAWHEALQKPPRTDYASLS